MFKEGRGGNWGTLRIPRDWGTTKSCFFDGNMFLGEFFVVILCWKCVVGFCYFGILSWVYGYPYQIYTP